MIKTLVHTIQKNMKLNKRYELGGFKWRTKKDALFIILFVFN